MKLQSLSRAVFAVALTVFGGTIAKADTIFASSQGTCCFNVDLHQVDTNNVQVTVSLTSGAQYFVSSGSGNHPGFAFNLDGTPTVSVTSISSPWALSDVTLSPITSNGPSMGTFEYYISNPGNGSNAHNDGPLVFNLFDASGISTADFIANSSGYYFSADIMNAAGQTGLSGINTPGTPSGPSPVPEPASLSLMGTGILAAAGLLRRKLSA
jgi:hypothetical protein